MNIESIVGRLQKVTNEVMTISSLRRIQDMSGERSKPCSCPHHRSTSGSRSAGKCNSSAREKKKSRCPCRLRPKICLCSPESDYQVVTAKSKKSDFDDDSKYRSEKSPQRDKQKDFIERVTGIIKGETVSENSKEIVLEDESKGRTEKSSRHDQSREFIDEKVDILKIHNASNKPKDIDIQDESKGRSEKSAHPDKLSEIIDGAVETLKIQTGNKKMKEIVLEDESKGRTEKSSRHDKPREFIEGAIETLKFHTGNKKMKDIDGQNESEGRSEKSFHDKSKESIKRIEEPLKFESKKSVLENESEGPIKKLTDQHQKKEFMDRAVDTKITNDRYISNNRNLDNEKPDNIHQPRARSVISQTPHILIHKEFSEAEKSNEDNDNIEQRDNFSENTDDLKKRNLELEDKLRRMDCSMSCLKQEGDKQAACLKDALERANNEAKLASRSRNLALDLAKQSREQSDLIRANREEIVTQMNVVKCNNTKLECECQELKCKLNEITENERKKCADFDDQVNRIKCAMKEKEVALSSEKSKLEKTVVDLTNNVKMQKKRICDLTLICKKQRDLLRENENSISTKIAQLTEAEDKIQSTSCRCRQMQEQIDDLECRLNEETVARENLQSAFDERQDNCNCELRIKDKIIEDQVDTIKRLKKLLQDSEKMAQQAASEFVSLREELHCLKQSNRSLRMALNETESRVSDLCEQDEYCERCAELEAQMNNLNEQREKAMMAAKFAAAKLCQISTEYESKLDCEKRHCDEINSLVERQETEILLLKKEILCVKEFRSRRSNDYMAYQ